MSITFKNKLLALPFVFLVVGCGKDPGISNNNNGGYTQGTPNGTLAGFDVIPIPAVDIANQIIPNLSQFYVTNKGPYVQVVKGTKQWHVYKYQGGSGSASWSSFTPSFTATYFRPVSMFYEKDNAFSIYWCNTDLSDDKYGMYNLNTSTPSFEFFVPGSPNGPYVISELIPPTTGQGTGHFWALLSNEIWKESAVAVPKKFDKVIDLPSAAQRIRTDAVMADPDDETQLWISAAQRLYQVSEVGNPSPPYGKIKSSWNFSSISATDRFQAILKVGGSIVVQFGNRVFKLSGTTFNKIGTLNASPSGTQQICTNGNSIYASDGTYYDEYAGSWKSYIGSGQNLSGNNATRFQELKLYTSGAFPIGCIYGGSTIYLLALDKLIRVTPLP